jgi:3-demethoxyubiquinol 3-hydroxylase
MSFPSPSSRPRPDRDLSPFDRVLSGIDQAARTLLASNTANRPYPADGLNETVLSDRDRKHVAALMRVNHTGEIAAQALYQGQAFVAQSEAIRQSLMDAGREETDHLAWCSQRIEELGGRTSLLGPLWYGGSFAIGVIAALASDRASLGFVAETERQVVDHLGTHLEQLPQSDRRSKAIIEQMAQDEARHGREAMDAGGMILPSIARRLMRLTAKAMTRTAYWI